MKKSLVVLACCLAMSAMLAYAQNLDDGYQMAHIVSIDKMAADAQHMSDSDRYKIAMRMNDTLYTCEASGSASLFMGWAPGKDLPAKLIDKMAADAQHMSDSDRYKIAMRMGDVLYKCEAAGSATLFMGWAPGKDFPAKLNDKTLLVKSPNGQTAELTVKSKKAGK